MEITVVSEDENPMLHRTDVTFRVSHVEATPDRLAVRDSLAARLNKDADEVVIRKLDTKFGMRTTYGEAKVYESPAEAKEVEQAYMLQRNKIAAGENGEVEAEEAGGPEVEEDVEEAEPEDVEEDVDEAEAAEPEDDESADSEEDAAAEEAADEGEAEAESDGDESDADDSEEDATADEADDEETEE